jgi:hypothetical protein
MDIGAGSPSKRRAAGRGGVSKENVFTFFMEDDDKR